MKGDGPLFGPDGTIVFRASDGPYGAAHRVRPDGTELRRILAHPIIATMTLSPDGRWLAAYSRARQEETGAILAFPLDGGSPVRVHGGGVAVAWSGNGKLLSVLSPTSRRVYVVPLPPGRVLPDLPADGFTSEEELARLPGVEVIESADVAIGPEGGVYAFTRETVQRNLYRIPLP